MKFNALEFEKPILELETKIEELRQLEQTAEREQELLALENQLQKALQQIYSSLTPWQRVQLARHTQRPFMLDYLSLCFSEFVELKGDRLYGEDASMPGGFATLDEYRCVVIGHQKGRDTKENLKRNFGSAHPEGYRKALRLMKLAEKFKLPIISLIDTPGAYPGIGAEARHIAEAIAVNLREMMLLRTPIIAAVIGEGGSGGALGIGVADQVLIFENAYYSVISPEGCAAILWKDRKYAAQAAEALKLTANEMKELGLVDEVVPEPLGGAHRNHHLAAAALKESLIKHLKALSEKPMAELLEQRYNKFRKFGVYAEIKE